MLRVWTPDWAIDRSPMKYRQYPLLDSASPNNVVDFFPNGDGTRLDQNFSETLARLLHLAPMSDLDDFKSLITRVCEIAEEECVDLEAVLGRGIWTRLCTFVDAEVPGDTDGSTRTAGPEEATGKSFPEIWRTELCRDCQSLEPTNWQTRHNPVDVLRCAALLLAPNSPNPAEKMEGFHAVKHFISLSSAKRPLIFRRTQALLCALDLSASLNLHEEALDLLNSILRDETIPNNLLWTSVLLLPHFRPFFIRILSTIDNFPRGTRDTPSQSSTITIDEGVFSLAKLELICKIRMVNHRRMHLVIEHRLFGDPVAPRSNPFQAVSSTSPLRILQSRTRPLGKMGDRELLAELGAATKRVADEEPSFESFVLRPGASMYSIKQTIHRLEKVAVLPAEYRKIMQIANGWTWSHADLPSLAPIEEVYLIKLNKPMSITYDDVDTDIVAPFETINPHDRKATFTEAIRIDTPSSSRPGSMVLIIRDWDLSVDRPNLNKRGKKNNGEAIIFRPGDYRVVFVRERDDGTTSYSYYSMIRHYIEAVILELDGMIKGSKRLPGHSIWTRRIPTKLVGDVFELSEDERHGGIFDADGRSISPESG